MAALVLQYLADNGEAPEFDPASTSDTAVVGSGRDTILVYKNTTGAPVNVTVVVPGNTFFGTPNDDNVVAVPAGGEAWIPMRKAYVDEGVATVTMADATGMEVALVRMS